MFAPWFSAACATWIDLDERFDRWSGGENWASTRNGPTTISEAVELEALQ